MEVHSAKCLLFIDRAGIEGFSDIIQLKHGQNLLSCRLC